MRRERLGDNAVKINTRDRLLRAWENSMELVLDYQTYKQEIKDNDDVCRVFDQFDHAVLWLSSWHTSSPFLWQRTAA